jgi:hypothetical protein
MGGSVAMLEWVQTATAPWSANTMVRLLSSAGLCGNLPAAKWLRAQGAGWPPAFVSGAQVEAGATLGCWNVSAVQWQLQVAQGGLIGSVSTMLLTSTGTSSLNIKQKMC